VLTDDTKIPGSVQNNTISENTVEKTFRAIYSNGVVRSQLNNTISLNIFHNNNWDIDADFNKDNQISSNTSSHPN
jgi:hypothetical protein